MSASNRSRAGCSDPCRPLFSSLPVPLCWSSSFFFNDTATTEIYTLSLHDALPISAAPAPAAWPRTRATSPRPAGCGARAGWRSEEHTSELQSHLNLVCRLLLEKKKQRPTPSRDERTDFHSATSA